MTAIATFLKDYEAALNACSVSRLTALHGTRFMQMSPRGSGWASAWRKNDDDFEASLDRALRFYRMLGASHFRIVDLRAAQAETMHTVARVAWRVENIDEFEIVTLDVSYMLRVRGDDARIVAFVDHGEEEQLRAGRHVTASPQHLLFRLPPTTRAASPVVPIAGPSDVLALGEVLNVLGRTG